MPDFPLTDTYPEQGIPNMILDPVTTADHPDIDIPDTEIDIPEIHVVDTETSTNVGMTNSRLTVIETQSAVQDTCHADKDHSTDEPDCKELSDSYATAGISVGLLAKQSTEVGMSNFHYVDIPNGRLSNTDPEMPESHTLDVSDSKISNGHLICDDPETGTLVEDVLLHPKKSFRSDDSSGCITWSLSTGAGSGETVPVTNGHVDESPQSHALRILCIFGALLNPLFCPVVLYYMYQMRRSWSRNQARAAYRYSNFAIGVAIMGICITIITIIPICIFAAARTYTVCKQPDVSFTATPSSFSALRDHAQLSQDECFSSDPQQNELVHVGQPDVAKSKHFKDMWIAPDKQLIKHKVNETYFILYFPDTEECKHVKI